MPETPYEAVLAAAEGLTRAETALAAEMLGTALLGSVYAVADGDRTAAVREFVAGYLAHTERSRTPAARTSRAVFAALLPDVAGDDRVQPAPDGVTWAGQLGRARPVDSVAYGDVYGDQTSYLVRFTYDDPALGGVDHAVVVLVDHNIGIVKDLFVGEPADRVLAEVRRAADSDELVWLRPVEPAQVRAVVDPLLRVTDRLSTLPEGGSLATDRMLAEARLATLPAPDRSPDDPDRGPGGPGGEDADALVESFLASEPAQGLDRGDGDGDSLRYVVRLILDFTRDAPDGDPLRWSPAVVGLFLLDWVHRRAVLDSDDVAVLPTVLHAWVRWAGERRDLPAAARAAIDEAVEVMAPEFTRLYASGERRDPAVAAVGRLLADGVDPSDGSAVREWLAAHPEVAEPVEAPDPADPDPAAADTDGPDTAEPHGEHRVPRPR